MGTECWEMGATAQTSARSRKKDSGASACRVLDAKKGLVPFRGTA